MYQYLYNVHYRRYVFSEVYRVFVRSVSQRQERQRGLMCNLVCLFDLLTLMQSRRRGRLQRRRAR